MLSTSKNKVRLSPRLQTGVGRRYSKNTLLKIIGTGFLILAAIVTISSFRLIVQQKNLAVTDANPKVLGASDVGFVSHTVQKNETIFSIAKDYSVDWPTIAAINGLDNVVLKTGQVLKIPKQ